MKKVLVLCSRSPYPAVSGAKIRMMNNIKMLSTEYDVDVLLITNKDFTDEDKFGLQKYCKNIIVFKISSYKYVLNTFLGLLKNTLPLQVNYYYFKNVKKWIDKNYSNYHIVFCNHIRTAEYVRGFSNIIKIVDLVDSMSMNYDKAIKNSKGIWNIIYRLEYKRLKQYEMRITKDFDKNIIISEIDKSYITGDNLNCNIEVINNFTSIKINNINLVEENNSLCFLGTMDYEPNVSAMNFFVNKVFPLIKKQKQDLILYIVGSRPIREILKYNEKEGIVVTGFVEDQSEYILKSSLFIAPMISGSGVQNKIIEAMFLGKCVITTSIGAEGLENLTGKELIIYDTPEEIGNKIIELLNNKNDRDKIGMAAKNYIQENLSEENITKKFLKYIRF